LTTYRLLVISGGKLTEVERYLSEIYCISSKIHQDIEQEGSLKWSIEIDNLKSNNQPRGVNTVAKTRRSRSLLIILGSIELVAVCIWWPKKDNVKELKKVIKLVISI